MGSELGYDLKEVFLLMHDLDLADHLTTDSNSKVVEEEQPATAPEVEISPTLNNDISHKLHDETPGRSDPDPSHSDGSLFEVAPEHRLVTEARRMMDFIRFYVVLAMSKTFATSAILLAVNIIFITIGGFVFSYVEKRGLEKKIEALTPLQLVITNATRYDDNLTLDWIQSNATAACSAGKYVPWTYGQSFNFALSVITTVGWGVMSPSTYTSKGVVCFYALFGIPIYGIFIALIKDKCGKLFRKSVRVSRAVSWYWIPLCIVIVVTIFTNILVNMFLEHGKVKVRAALNQECDFITPYYHWQANSTMWDGVYFGFITVSTIGFGDVYHRLVECNDQSMDAVMSAVVGFIIFSILLGMCAHLFDVISEQSEESLRGLSSKIAKRLGSVDSELGSTDKTTYER